MGNIGPKQVRLDVLPEPEWAVAADGEIYEWTPTAPARPVRHLTAPATRVPVPDAPPVAPGRGRH